MPVRRPAPRHARSARFSRRCRSVRNTDTAILLRIEQISRGHLPVQQGTLYPALYRLEDRGLLDDRVGHVGEQPAREVLHAHGRRAQTAARRALELGADRRRDDGRVAGDAGVAMIAVIFARSIALERCCANSSGRRAVEREMDDEFRSHIAHRADDLERRGLSREAAERAARVEFGGVEAQKGRGPRRPRTPRLGRAPRQRRVRGARRRASPDPVAHRRDDPHARPRHQRGGILGVERARVPRTSGPRRGVVHAHLRVVPLRHERHHRFPVRCRSATTSRTHARCGRCRSSPDGSTCSSRCRPARSRHPARSLRAASSTCTDRCDRSPGGCSSATTAIRARRSPSSATTCGIPPSARIRAPSAECCGSTGRRSASSASRRRSAARRSTTRLWLPYTLRGRLQLGPDDPASPNAMWLFLDGRLAPGSTRGDVLTEARVIAAQQDIATPGRHTAVFVTNGSLVARPGNGLMVTGIVAVVFVGLACLALVACASVVSILLAIADGRRTEMALRMALGAGAPRLAAMLGTESLMLASVAGMAACALTFRLPGLLMTWIVQRPINFSLAPDWHVFAFLLVTTVLAALVAANAPIRAVLSLDLNSTLRRIPDGTGGRARRGNALMSAEIGGATALLVATIALTRLPARIANSPPRFDARHVLAMTLRAPQPADGRMAELTRRPRAIAGDGERRARHRLRHGRSGERRSDRNHRGDDRRRKGAERCRRSRYRRPTSTCSAFAWSAAAPSRRPTPTARRRSVR